MIQARLVLIKIALLLTLTACGNAALVITAAPLPTITPVAPAPASASIHITIDGPVERPGDYALPPGSRADDAVRVAGGPTADADLAQINLAQILRDGQHIHVPRLGEVLPTSTPYGLSADSRVDINLADTALLETLPKIGPTTAQRIIEYREMWGSFDTAEQIQEVQGIGPATFAQIKDLITVNEHP